MFRKEILISGFGGQGIILSGRILGFAAVLADLWATMMISHGTETRGGYVRSQVVISDEPIDSQIVESPDIFCAMSQPAYNRFFNLVKNGTIIYDPDFVNPLFIQQGSSVTCTRVLHSSGTSVSTKMHLAVSAQALSIEMAGTEFSANIVMLGVVLQRLELFPFEQACIALEKIVPHSKEANLKALEAGFLLKSVAV
jgi:2-oxoglutarate ferredoxin oxidoreductase subunit gamma